MPFSVEQRPSQLSSQQGVIELQEPSEVELMELEELFEEEDFTLVEEEFPEEGLPEELEEMEELNEEESGEIEPDETLTLYLREVGKTPLLKAKEERRLFEQLERGREAKKKLEGEISEPEQKQKLKEELEAGEKAKEHLIRANLRLVIWTAKRYRDYGLSFLDLIQEGNLGLLKAVEKFDWTKGYKFSSYATWQIRTAIRRALTTQRTIRLPAHLGDEIGRVEKARAQLRDELGREPTPEEISERVNLTPTQVLRRLNSSRTVWRFPLELDRSNPKKPAENRTLGETIEDESTPLPPEAADQTLLEEELKKVLEVLSPREQRVLELRFGLKDGQSHTLKEIGRKFGLTRERIRQIEKKALGKLRHPSRARQLKDYL